MKSEIFEAINQAYIETQDHNNPQYRIVTEEQLQIIIATLQHRCGVNVTYSADTNYSTSYQLQITDQGVPTPAESAKKRINEHQLPRNYYVLLINISWLGPFAMKYWNKFERGTAPIGFSEPNDVQEKTKEECVINVLEQHGIRMLAEEELEELVPYVDIALLDDATVNVRHLLFAEYI